MLCVQEVLSVCVVLEDTADQLEVLGNIIISTCAPSRECSVLMADRSVMLCQQRHARQSQGAGTNKSHHLNRTKDSELLKKIQTDRLFVSKVIDRLLAELRANQMFLSLLESVEEENDRKSHLRDVINREEESCRRIRSLQKHLTDLHTQKNMELQSRDELTAHLKDQLQELKVKTSLEKKYVKNSCKQLVYQTHKHNNHNEGTLQQHIQLLNDRLEEERRVHQHMKSFLKDHLLTLSEQDEWWMEKYNQDMERKQQEVSTLKHSKNSNVTILQLLSSKYRDSEEVVLDDRVLKENLRRQLEKDNMERNAATMVQAWWRGTLVRRGLGPFKKGKKAKETKRKEKKKKK